MPSNKHAQIRYRVLDGCFSNFRRNYHFNDLLEKCNDALYHQTGKKYSISVRTLRSDIQYLRDLAGQDGVEITADNDGEGSFYRYSRKGYSIFKKELSEEELSQLKQTVMTLRRFKGIPNFDWMDELVVKLENRLNIKEQEQSVLSLDEVENYSGLDNLQDLFFAIVNKQVLRISYRTFQDEDFQWTIHPHFLKEYNNRWFLFGWNPAEGRTWNIPLDRITDIEQIHEEYIPGKVDFNKFFDNVIGATVPDGEKMTIKLKFSPTRFQYVMTKPLHKSQRNLFDEASIEITVIPNNELDALVLSFGQDVEVVSPASYRSKIKDILTSTLNRYEDTSGSGS